MHPHDGRHFSRCRRGNVPKGTHWLPGGGRQRHHRPTRRRPASWASGPSPRRKPPVCTGAWHREYCVSGNLGPDVSRCLVPIRSRLASRGSSPSPGKKNHYGSRSKRGTEVAAIFYTLFETANLSGFNPRGYVLEAARRAVRRPGAVTLPSDLS